MKITRMSEIVSITDAIVDSLDSNHERDLDRIKDIIHNISQALGCLIEMLEEKKIISCEQVGEFLSYQFEIEE